MLRQTASRVATYKALLALPSTSASLKKFRGNEPRLDSLWTEIVDAAPSSLPAKTDLIDFIKMVLIIFHSNAALERSFSLNKECMVVNQKETSLIANRVVQDAVVSAGGIHKSMIHAARNAHSRYKKFLAARTKAEKQEAAKLAEKRKAAQELQELSKKRDKIMKDAHEQASAIDQQIRGLGKRF